MLKTIVTGLICGSLRRSSAMLTNFLKAAESMLKQDIQARV